MAELDQRRFFSVRLGLLFHINLPNEEHMPSKPGHDRFHRLNCTERVPLSRLLHWFYFEKKWKHTPEQVTQIYAKEEMKS